MSSRGIFPSLALSAHIASPPTPHQTMPDDTGPLTDRLLLSPLVVEKCFFFFSALRINLNLNLSFFSSVASSLCSHPVDKPYSLLMDSIRRAGAVCPLELGKSYLISTIASHSLKSGSNIALLFVNVNVCLQTTTLSGYRSDFNYQK